MQPLQVGTTVVQGGSLDVVYAELRKTSAGLFDKSVASVSHRFAVAELQRASAELFQKSLDAASLRAKCAVVKHVAADASSKVATSELQPADIASGTDSGDHRLIGQLTLE